MHGLNEGKATKVKTNSIRNLAIVAAVVGTFAVGMSSAANAGGFLGGIIEDLCGNCGVGDTLDQLNNDLGNPVDHGGAILCDIYLPGCGEVMEGYYAYNRGGVDGLIDHELDGDNDSDDPQ